MNKVEAAREWICSHNDGDVLYVKDAFIGGANWAIDKACEWLERNFNMPNDFEYHFRKAMEE